jgi:2'-5' RNA ligase
MDLSKQGEKQRLFIGIPLDEHAQQRVNTLVLTVLGRGTDIRCIPATNRHLTLAFLGDTSRRETERLIQQFDQVYQSLTRFEYTLTRLVRFPGPRGRIIALTGEPTRPLENLFQITAKLLQDNEIEFDQKKFRPHITLARIRKPKQLKVAVDQQVSVTLDINSVVLYQSTLTKSGSVYSSLKETLLS